MAEKAEAPRGKLYTSSHKEFQYQLDFYVEVYTYTYLQTVMKFHIGRQKKKILHQNMKIQQKCDHYVFFISLNTIYVDLKIQIFVYLKIRLFSSHFFFSSPISLN